MKTFFFILLILINFCNRAAAQAGVSINNPNASAALDLSSISNKGLLIPRVSLSGLSDSNSIAGAHPAVALWLYNTNAGLGDGTGFYTWQGSNWAMMEGDNLGNHTATQGVSMNNNPINNNGTTRVVSKIIRIDPNFVGSRRQIVKLEKSSNHCNRRGFPNFTCINSGRGHNFCVRSGINIIDCTRTGAIAMKHIAVAIYSGHATINTVCVRLTAAPPKRIQFKGAAVVTRKVSYLQIPPLPSPYVTAIVSRPGGKF